MGSRVLKIIENNGNNVNKVMGHTGSITLYRPYMLAVTFHNVIVIWAMCGSRGSYMDQNSPSRLINPLQ